MPPRLKPRPAVLEQQQPGSGYILKWLTEEQFWNLGRHVFFKALREANTERAKRKGVGR